MTRKPDNKRPSRSRRKPSRCARRPSRPFYRTVPLPAPDEDAAETMGASEEVITLIRSLMADLLKARPDALPLFLRSSDSLVRAIAAEYRRAQARDKSLAGNLTRVLDQLSAEFGQPPTILPPDTVPPATDPNP